MGKQAIETATQEEGNAAASGLADLGDDKIPINEESAAAKADLDELDPDATVYAESLQLSGYTTHIKVLVGDNYSLVVHAWTNQLAKTHVITVTPEEAKKQVSKTESPPTSQQELAQFIVSQLALEDVVGREGEKALCFVSEDEDEE